VQPLSRTTEAPPMRVKTVIRGKRTAGAVHYCTNCANDLVAGGEVDIYPAHRSQTRTALSLRTYKNYVQVVSLHVLLTTAHAAHAMSFACSACSYYTCSCYKGRGHSVTEQAGSMGLAEEPEDHQDPTEGVPAGQGAPVPRHGQGLLPVLRLLPWPQAAR
jgi:hypothetical protein